MVVPSGDFLRFLNRNKEEFGPDYKRVSRFSEQQEKKLNTDLKNTSKEQ